jgi:hypothetical protein
MANEAKDERDKKEIERLRSQHPDYRAMKENWEFFLRSYEGGSSYVNEDTLFTHARENKQDYTERKKRAHYSNYCQPLTDFVPNFIYASDVERDPKSLKPAFDNFISNVNRGGLHITDFMREVAEESRMYGHVFIQVDKPRLPGNAGKKTVSVAQKRALKLDPYFVKMSPLEVLDWVTDEQGNYIYLKRVECLDLLVNRARTTVERYTEWYVDECVITTIDITNTDKPVLYPAENIPNTLGKLPFIKAVHKTSKANRDLSVSFLTDIAGQNNSVFNKTSLIDEFLFRQCFNVLTMPSNTQVQTKDTVEGVIGNANILEYPDEAKNAPAYLSPPATPAEFIQLEREAIVMEMYRTAMQDISSEIMAGANRSGDAARQSMGQQVPMIARQADMLQQTEQQLFRLWAEMNGDTWDGKIAYKDDYSVTGLQDLILQFTSIFSAAKILSPTWVREEWKRLIREYDGKITPEKMEKIFSEIEGITDDEIKDLIKGPEPMAAAGLPSTANLTQGKAQSGQSDKQRSLRTGDKSHQKEGNRDVNKSAKGAKGSK